jgi:hypothetical protein
MAGFDPSEWPKFIELPGFTRVCSALRVIGEKLQEEVR